LSPQKHNIYITVPPSLH